MNLTELVAMFHGKLDEKLDQVLANQEKIMDDIAAAVAAMNEAAAVLRAHVAASEIPGDLSGLREATAGLNAVLHPTVPDAGDLTGLSASGSSEPTPAEVTVPDPVNGDPGPDLAPAAF